MKCKRMGYYVAVCLLTLGCQSNEKTRNNVELWYAQPADEWMKAIPVGNGRLGGMVYGGVEEETIALNESSMWSGEFNKEQDPAFGKQRMDDLRKLFLSGNIQEGNRIAGDNLCGNGSSFGTHLPIGDLKLQFTYPEGEVSHYRRSLHINNAISEVTYKVGNISYKRELFATNPDDVIVMRMTANQKKAINARLYLSLLREADVRTENNQLIFDGKVVFPKHGSGGVSFEGRIAVTAEGGSIELDSTAVCVKDADALTFVVDVRTNYKDDNYRSRCARAVEKAMSDQSYEVMKKAHIDDYAPLFARVSLSLGKDLYANLPTDKRWQQSKEGKSDTGLDALLFQYGRYLTLASSRENSPLPIALQGFFNDNLACNMPWTNDYHLDINTQQNYWVANVGNLAECNIPLFNYIKDLATHGAVTAEKVYGCKGWTAHTTANIWGYTAPSGSIAWGLFPTASSWTALHLWTQYEYTLNNAFLADVAYPLLKGNAEFLLDYMVEDPNTGYLMTGPSISPENSFLYEGANLCASMMPTCDRVLVHEIFNACIQSAAVLHVDTAFSQQLQTALGKLPPIRLGKNGGVREWFDDYEEAQPNHRHTTHLLALYPYHQITPDQTPELAEGARKTIEKRLAAEGWEDTEWSRSNMICFYARLKDPVKAYESIRTFEKVLTRENLFSISPGGIAGAPFDIYAFDGNPAAAAGIAEMLIQTHQGYVEYLPCLPQEWKEGSYQGLCIKGGGEVSASWSNATIAYASLKATADHTFQVKIPQKKSYNLLLNGKPAGVTPNEERLISVAMKAGDVLEIN